MKIEQVPSPRSLCGEGPHWDVASQSLYYIDINGPESTILRYDFRENKTYAAKVDKEPLMSFVLPIENTTDQFLVGTKNAGKVIRWDGKSPKGELLRTAFEVEPIEYTNRLNDAKCDPSGRFFGGTMRMSECNALSNTQSASLYSFDLEQGCKRLKTNLGISNGLAWNPAINKFYFVDSCTHELLQFDFNIETGDICK